MRFFMTIATLIAYDVHFAKYSWLLPHGFIPISKA